MRRTTLLLGLWLCACDGSEEVNGAGRDAAARDASDGEPDSGREPGGDGGDEGRDDASSDVPDSGAVSDSGTVRDASNSSDASNAGDASTAADGGVCSACGACVESRRIESALHMSGGIDYPDPPPMGGNHDPCWSSFGVHDSEVPDERWVHNLEHGGVIFLYNCPGGCATEVAALVELTKGRPFALVTPYAALPQRFGVVAWGNRLVSECYDDAAFRAFYEAYVDMGPESITAGPPSGC